MSGRTRNLANRARRPALPPDIETQVSRGEPLGTPEQRLRLFDQVVTPEVPIQPDPIDPLASLSEEDKNVQLTLRLSELGQPVGVALPIGTPLAEINRALEDRLRRFEPGPRNPGAVGRVLGAIPRAFSDVAQQTGAIVAQPFSSELREATQTRQEQGAGFLEASFRALKEDVELPGTEFNPLALAPVVGPLFSRGGPLEDVGPQVPITTEGAFEVAFDPLNVVPVAKGLSLGVRAGGRFGTQLAKEGAEAAVRSLDPRITKATLGAFSGEEFVSSGPLRQEAFNGQIRAAQDVGILPDLAPLDDVIDIAFEPNNARIIGEKLADIPRIGEALAAGNRSLKALTPEKRGFIGRQVLIEEGEKNNQIAMSYVQQIGTQRDVFGVTDPTTGLLATGKFKGVSVNQIAENPSQFKAQLTPTEVEWLNRMGDIEEAVFQNLKRNGVEINKLGLGEVERYAGRTVVMKVTPEGDVIEIGFVGGGPRKLTGKIGAEKSRIFKSIEEAQDNGFVYAPYEEAVALKLRNANTRIANLKLTTWLERNLPDDVKVRAPIDNIPAVRRARASEGQAKSVLGSLDNLIDITKRAVRGEVPAAKTLQAIAKFHPERHADLERALAIGPDDFNRIINNLSSDFLATTKTTRQGFRDALERARLERAGRGMPTAQDRLGARSVTAGELTEAVNLLAKDERTATTMLNKIVKESFRFNQQERQLALRKVGDAAIEARPDFAIANKAAGSERRAAVLEATRTKADQVQIPAFRPGIVFEGTGAQEFKKSITEALATPETSKALRAIQQLNLPGRLFMLAGDASLFTIQLYASAYAHTGAVFKSGATFGQAFATAIYGTGGARAARRSHSRLIWENRELLQRHRGLIMSSDNEFTAALQRGGLFAPRNPLDPGLTGLQRAQGVLGTVAAPFRPFQRGFEMAMDKAGIEMAGALESMAKNASDLNAIDDYVNNMRGMTSSARLGTGANQQLFESALLLAPRYRRAIFALHADALQGGIRGQLARKAYMKMFLGTTMIVSALTVGLGLKAGKTEKEILNDVALAVSPVVSRDGKLRQSPMFWNFRIGGQIVGPGSKFRSDTSLLGKLAVTGADIAGRDVGDNQSLLDFSEFRNNPGVKWVRGQLAGGPATAIDILEGKDYLGNPIEKSLSLKSAQDIGERVGENFTPIWVKTALFEGEGLDDPTGAATRGSAEAGGLRAFPESPASQLNQLRLQGMRDRDIDVTDKGFRDLDFRLQQEIDLAPTIVSAKERRSVQNRERQSEYQEFQDKRTEIQDEFEQNVTGSFEQLGRSKGFRDRLGELYDRRTTRFADNEVVFTEARAFIEDLGPSTDEFNRDVITYGNLVFAPELTDPETGEFDFNEKERILAGLKGTAPQPEIPIMGEQRIAEIQQFLRERQLPVIQELRRDQDLLKEYWQITEDKMALWNVTEEYEQWLSLNSQERRQFEQDHEGTNFEVAQDAARKSKVELRANNLEIARALHKWEYVLAPGNLDLEIELGAARAREAAGVR